MKNLAQLNAEFASKAIDPCILFLLRSEDALAYINRGQTLGLRLLGVEGFRITKEGGFQPVQEWSNDIADYGGTDFVKDTFALITTLVANEATFQVVFEEN